VVAIVLALAFLVTLTIKNEASQSDEATTPDAQKQAQTPTESRQFTGNLVMLIGVMSIVRFLQVAGVGTATIYFNVYMDTELALSPGNIGIIAAIGRLIAVPTALIAPRLMRYRGIGSVAVWASLFTALCLLPLALIPHWSAAALAYVAVTALTSLRFTAFIVYIMELVPTRQQAMMAGTGEMAAGSSFALMALSGGYILAVFNFRDLFLLGAGLSLLGTLLFWLHLRAGKVKYK
jgi:predicted MFS family arabinose efflux permease